MRYLTSENDFYNCSEEARRNGAFFIPVGLVTSSDVTDNYINLPFLAELGFDVLSVVLMDYDTRLAASSQPTIIINKGVFLDDTAYSHIVVQVNILNIETKCFYFKLQTTVGFLYTEVYALIDFNECKNYMRFESGYPKTDSFKHDLERGDSAFNNLGTIYWLFPNGAKYRNFLWVEGNLRWNNGKITKTYEGLSNILTKERHSEEYQIYSPKMPDWYARAFINVMGGSDIAIYVNQKETRHKKFEVTDFELQMEQKTCLVLPTGKLRAFDKQVFFGCKTDVGTVESALAGLCKAFVEMTIGQIGVAYFTGLKELYFDSNLPDPTYTAFEIRGYRSYDNAPVYSNDINAALDINFTFPIGDIAGIEPKGLLTMTNEQPYQNPSVPSDFYCYFDFYITIIRPESCPDWANDGKITRTVKFTTRVYKLANGNIYAPESEKFLDLRLTTP